MSIWYEKYRPESVDEMILPESIGKLYQSIIEKKDLPHLLLYSAAPGTGKTTAARAICQAMGYETMFVNASEDARIDTIRGRLRRFCSDYSLDMDTNDGFKAVILDEIDNASPAFHDAMRGFIEEFHESVRFIVTCNHIQRVPQPIQDRMTVIEYAIPEGEKTNMMKAMIRRCLFILEQEGVEVTSKAVIAETVKKHFPNNRSILNDLQRYARANENLIDEGILSQLRSGLNADEVWKHIKDKNFKELRKVAVPAASEYPVFIRKLYDVGYNVVGPKSLPVLIESIGENQKFERQVADLEIHVTYLLLTLMMGINDWK